MGKTYHVYKITNIHNGEFYIGYRRTKCNPEKDLGVKYFTSGVLKEHFRKNVDSYEKQILHTSNIERECFWREQYFIMQNFKNVLCKNRHYSVKIHKQTIESLVKGLKPKKEKVRESGVKKRIWSDIHGKFVDLPIEEYNRLVNKEKYLNGYGGRSRKVI